MLKWKIHDMGVDFCANFHFTIFTLCLFVELFDYHFGKITKILKNNTPQRRKQFSSKLNKFFPYLGTHANFLGKNYVYKNR